MILNGSLATSVLQIAYGAQVFHIAEPCTHVLIGSESVLAPELAPHKASILMHHVRNTAFELRYLDGIWTIRPKSVQSMGRLTGPSETPDDQLIGRIDLQMGREGEGPETERRVEEYHACMRKGAYTLFFDQDRIDFLVPRDTVHILSAGASILLKNIP